MGARMRAGYQARVTADGRSLETVEIDEDSDRAAIFTAFGAASPFGHSLWSGRRFLGYFEGGEGRFGWLSPQPRPPAQARALRRPRSC